MKKFSVLAVTAIVTIGISFASCDSKKSIGAVKLVSDADSVSYIIGKAQASGMKKQMESQMEQWPGKGNINAFIAGVYDGMENSDDSLFLGKDMMAADEFIRGFFTNLQENISESNRVEGDKFLAENKGKSGVITTESGLQYKVITEGNGAKPADTDNIKIHYTGKFLDGNVFQSSVGSEPLEGPAGGFVPGFTEGILLMSVGSKYVFWIPSDLAYGLGNQNFPPNKTLEFEVELLEILK